MWFCMGSRRFSYGLASGMISAMVFGAIGYAFGRKADELAERAETDALTSLYNARGFEGRLSAEIARTIRYHTPLSLLLIDIDPDSPTLGRVRAAVRRGRARGGRDGSSGPGPCEGLPAWERPQGSLPSP